MPLYDSGKPVQVLLSKTFRGSNARTARCQSRLAGAQVRRQIARLRPPRDSVLHDRTLDRAPTKLGNLETDPVTYRCSDGNHAAPSSHSHASPRRQPCRTIGHGQSRSVGDEYRAIVSAMRRSVNRRAAVRHADRPLVRADVEHDPSRFDRNPCLGVARAGLPRCATLIPSMTTKIDPPSSITSNVGCLLPMVPVSVSCAGVPVRCASEASMRSFAAIVEQAGHENKQGCHGPNSVGCSTVRKMSMALRRLGRSIPSSA
jgi:hypothetical protein